jgi:hypothetical protein
MNVQSIIHRPEYIVPDATIDSISPSQLVDVVNMRLSRFTPAEGRNVGLRSITGNTLIDNPYLPAGENLAVGACSDTENGRVIFALWNSNGNHGIFISQTENDIESIVPIIRWTGLNFQQTDYVSMAYNRGILLWACPNTEPRYIDVQKGIDTERGVITGQPPANGYGQPYNPYNFDQLRRPPQYPPYVEYVTPRTGATNTFNWNDLTPLFENGDRSRPAPYITQDGYQIAYNYVYEDLTESRISEPSRFINGLLQNLGTFDISMYAHGAFLHPQEFAFVQSGNFVIKIKWYIRRNNEGNWILFAEKARNAAPDFLMHNYNATGPTPVYGVIIPKLNTLTSLAAINPSATLPVDGIAPRVAENLFASNRVIHGGLLFNFNIELPGAVVNNFSDTGINRKQQMFLPMKRQKKFALGFYDSKDRLIGTSNIGQIQPDYTPGYIFNLRQPYPGTTIALTGNQTYRQLNQYMVFSYNGTSVPVDDSPGVISITPSNINATQILNFDSQVDKVKALVANEFEAPFFIRTIVRLYWVFVDEQEIFYYGALNIMGTISDSWKGALRLYGIGFEFSGKEPINYSDAQNYYVSFRGITDFYPDETNANDNTRKFLFDQDFKITAQDKNILLSKINDGQFNFDITDLKIITVFGRSYKKQTSSGNYSTVEVILDPFKLFNGPGEPTFTDVKFEFLPFYDHSQTLGDILLYSKNEQAAPEYKVIPSLVWTADEFKNKVPKYYLGDCFGVIKRYSIQAPSVPNYYISSQQGIIKIENWTYGFDYNLQSMWGNFFVVSMNQNDPFLEIYNENLGSVVVPSLNNIIKPQNLARTYAHGEQFLEGTQLNNWFTFPVTNRKTVTGNIGKIVRVLNQSMTSNQGENIYLYCTNGIEMVFLGKVQQTGTDGTGVLSLSTNIFGTTNVFRLPYGIKNPRHITQTTSGLTYYFDSANKVLVQVSSSGQDAISEQKRFQTDTQLIEDTAVMGFDPFNMEVVLVGEESGLAYKIDEEKYQGRRIHARAEAYAFCSTVANPRSMYGIYNGRVFRFVNRPPFDQEITINEQPISQSWRLVSNHEINKHKVFSFIRLLADYNNADDKIDWNVFVEGYIQGNIPAIATLEPADFVKRSNFYQATIKTSQSVDSFDGPLISGPYAIISFTGNEKYKNIIFAEIGYTLPPAQ